MVNEDDRSLEKILEEYREEKRNSLHNNAYTQENIQNALRLLKEKNAKNASFEDEKRAYKNAGLYQGNDEKY